MQLTPKQREHRIRKKHARRETLAAELRRIDIDLAPLEREHALSLGMPTLRGKALVAAMDREAELAMAREARAA